jgi:hypothetical protein
MLFLFPPTILDRQLDFHLILKQMVLLQQSFAWITSAVWLPRLLHATTL